MFWERFYNICLTHGTKPNPVAKEIGISSGSLTKWKNTGALPNGETLVKLADYLDCSVDYLLGRKISPETEDNGAEALLSTDALTPSQQKLVDYASDLTNEELQETLDFIGYLKAKRSS